MLQNISFTTCSSLKKNPLLAKYKWKYKAPERELEVTKPCSITGQKLNLQSDLSKLISCLALRATLAPLWKRHTHTKSLSPPHKGYDPDLEEEVGQSKIAYCSCSLFTN